jgi:hypothetical protein
MHTGTRDFPVLESKTEDGRAKVALLPTLGCGGPVRCGERRILLYGFLCSEAGCPSWDKIQLYRNGNIILWSVEEKFTNPVPKAREEIRESRMMAGVISKEIYGRVDYD